MDDKKFNLYCVSGQSLFACVPTQALSCCLRHIVCVVFESNIVCNCDNCTLDELDQVYCNIVNDYYESLLISTYIPNDEVLQMRQKVWTATSVKVTSLMSHQLLCPLSSFEILQPIIGIGIDVCPGVDGMGRDFFLIYWELIADDLLAAFQEMFNTGIMPQMWKEGLICLIPKGDVVTDEVKGWHSITPLNTI